MWITKFFFRWVPSAWILWWSDATREGGWFVKESCVMTWDSFELHGHRQPRVMIQHWRVVESPCARGDLTSAGILSRNRNVPQGALKAFLGPSQPTGHRTLNTTVPSFYGLFLHLAVFDVVYHEPLPVLLPALNVFAFSRRTCFCLFCPAGLMYLRCGCFSFGHLVLLSFCVVIVKVNSFWCFERYRCSNTPSIVFRHYLLDFVWTFQW